MFYDAITKRYKKLWSLQKQNNTQQTKKRIPFDFYFLLKKIGSPDCSSQRTDHKFFVYFLAKFLSLKKNSRIKFFSVLFWDLNKIILLFENNLVGKFQRLKFSLVVKTKLSFFYLVKYWL